MAQGAVASWVGCLVCGSHGPGAVPEPLQRSDLLSKRPESLALLPHPGILVPNLNQDGPRVPADCRGAHWTQQGRTLSSATRNPFIRPR